MRLGVGGVPVGGERAREREFAVWVWYGAPLRIHMPPPPPPPHPPAPPPPPTHPPSQVGARDIVIDQTEPRQTVYIYNCCASTIQVWALAALAALAAWGAA